MIGLRLPGSGVEATPELVEALLGFPGDRERVGRLAFLAALERGAFPGRLAVVPGLPRREADARGGSRT